MISESSLPLNPAPMPPALPPPLPAPRVWSALAVPVIAIVAALLFSRIVFEAVFAGSEDYQAWREGSEMVAAEASEREGSGDPTAQTAERMEKYYRGWEELMERFFTRPYAVATCTIPVEGMLAAIALVAAALSPRRLGERLGYVRSALPWWSLPILLLATIFFDILGGLLSEWIFPGPNEVTEYFLKLARAGSGPVVLLNFALMSLQPGFVEETLFRGYMQRRLLERWKPVLAIGVSSLLFCALHYHPVHFVGVAPVAIWLGTLAWRCGSVWPGIFCHAALNALLCALMRWGLNPEDSTFSPLMWTFLLVGGVATAVAILLMRRYPPGRLATAPAAA